MLKFTSPRRLGFTGQWGRRQKDVKRVFPSINTAGAVCGPCYVWREVDIIFQLPRKSSFWKYACTIILGKRTLYREHGMTTGTSRYLLSSIK